MPQNVAEVEHDTDAEDEVEDLDAAERIAAGAAGPEDLDPVAEAEKSWEWFKAGDWDDGCRDLPAILEAGAIAAHARGDAARAAQFRNGAAHAARELGYSRAAHASRTRTPRLWARAPRRDTARRARRRTPRRAVRLSAVASAGDGPPSEPPAPAGRREHAATPGGAS